MSKENSPFLGRVRVKVTYTANTFPPFRSAVDMAFSSMGLAILIAALHSYFRNDGFTEKGFVTVALFAAAIYGGILLAWWMMATLLKFAPRFSILYTVIMFALALGVFALLPAVFYQLVAKYDVMKPYLDLSPADITLAQFVTDGLHVWWPTAIIIPVLITYSFYRRSL
jgi:hypothetical protein